MRCLWRRNSMDKPISHLEKVLKISFKNKNILHQALTHKSYAMESCNAAHNERLEFLGDSLLTAIVGSYLYKKYKDYDEEMLSRYKASLVSRKSLLTWAKEIDLGKYLYISKNEREWRGRKRINFGERI